MEMYQSITLKDFPFICRTCFNKEDLKELDETRLLDTFKNVLNIQMEFEDELPKNICNKCIIKLEDISAFVNIIKCNDTYLKGILNQSKFVTLNEKSDVTLCDSDIAEDTVQNLDDVDDKEEISNICNLSIKNEDLTVSKQNIKPFKKIISRKSQPSTCEACGEKFNSKRTLVEHQKKNSSCRVEYRCNNCDKAFFTKIRLNIHMRCHTKEAPFECKICLKKFRHAPNLKRHVDIIHKGLKPYKCDICGKEFSRLMSKNEHVYGHTGERPYVCSYCGKTFSAYANHFAHIYLHKISNGEITRSTLRAKKSESSNQLEVECTICDKSFSSARAIFQHSHARKQFEKQFLCTVCGKAFLRKAQLQTHSLLHTGEKPYVCKHCGKQFRHVSSYKSHILVHTGEKPYQCRTCQKCFVQSEHLKQHMKTHTGERPHKCGYCGKEFAQKSNLVVHTRIHTGETPYHCSVCKKGFYDSSSMKKHEKGHEGGNYMKKEHT